MKHVLGSCLILCCTACSSPQQQLRDSIDRAQWGPAEQAITQRHVDVNARDSRGDTPLLRTLRSYKKSHLEEKRELFTITYELLKAGADPNAPAEDVTPLHLAVDSHDLQLVALLLHYGANREGRDRFGETPIWTALYRRDTPMLAFLLRKGADRNAPDRIGRTPRQYLQQLGMGNTACGRLILSGE